MVLYPNQKIITVSKSIKDKDDNFLQIANANWEVACQTLTYSAFKLYLYISRHKNNYRFALSYEDVNSHVPMNRKSYDKAVSELKDSGYLENTRGKEWTFHDAV